MHHRSTKTKDIAIRSSLVDSRRGNVATNKEGPGPTHQMHLRIGDIAQRKLPQVHHGRIWAEAFPNNILPLVENMRGKGEITLGCASKPHC